jgi:hypothetical protein
MLECIAGFIEFEVASGSFRTFGFLLLDVVLLIMVIFHRMSDFLTRKRELKPRGYSAQYHAALGHAKADCRRSKRTEQTRRNAKDSLKKRGD